MLVYGFESILVFRFEGKVMTIIEHFHSIFLNIDSRMRAEQFKVHAYVASLTMLNYVVPTQRRVLSCLRAWDQMSVYHYNVVDKLRLTFIGKTTEEMEKLKAFVSQVHQATPYHSRIM